MELEPRLIDSLFETGQLGCIVGILVLDFGTVLLERFILRLSCG